MASKITFDRLVTGICDSVHWPYGWSHTQTTDLWPAFSHVKKGGSHLLSGLWQSLEPCWAVTKYWSFILSLVCHPVFFPTVHPSIHSSICSSPISQCSRDYSMAQTKMHSSLFMCFSVSLCMQALRLSQMPGWYLLVSSYGEHRN